MKDKVIHFYFGVDRKAVWLAVSDRIPAVKTLIKQILHDLETGYELPIREGLNIVKMLTHF